MTVSRTRQEEVHTRGAAIDDTLDPPDHDVNAADLADTLDFALSQLVKITGETKWEDPPAATIKALALGVGISLTFGIYVSAGNFAKGANIPGVTLNLTTFDGDMGTPASPGTANLFLLLNGRVIRGASATTIGDWFPGDAPASGDVKVDFPKGIKTNDLILTIALK